MYDQLNRLDPQSYFMLMAKVAALRSTCNSRTNGAVIVRDKRIISTGYNGTVSGKPQCSDKGSEYCFRRNVKGPENDKYNICPSVHAEANAINQAARFGISLEGCDIYCTLAPCYVCLKNIASVGIKKVFYELPYQSTNKDRDELWANFNNVGIEGYELILSEQVKEFIFDRLKSKSSIRRLLENENA